MKSLGYVVVLAFLSGCLEQKMGDVSVVPDSGERTEAKPGPAAPPDLDRPPTAVVFSGGGG